MGCDNTIFFLTPAHEVSEMASVEAIITASAALPIIFRVVIYPYFLSFLSYIVITTAKLTVQKLT